MGYTLCCSTREKTKDRMPRGKQATKLNEVENTQSITIEELLEIIEKKAKDMFEQEIVTLKSEINVLKNEVHKLTQDRDLQKAQNEKLRFEINKGSQEIEDLKMKIDDMEQCSYERDVQVVGLSESDEDGDDLNKMVKIAEQKMGLKIKEDIEEIHRLGRKTNGKTRDLIIRFKTKASREVFYQNRKKTSPSKHPINNIYINDRITRYRKGLFYEARKLYKNKQVVAAWTQHGNVLIRKSENDRPIEITCYENLQEIVPMASTEEIEEHIPRNNSDISLGSESLKSHISDYEIYVEPDDDFLIH